MHNAFSDLEHTFWRLGEQPEYVSEESMSFIIVQCVSEKSMSFYGSTHTQHVSEESMPFMILRHS